jgi:hypothetical protein
VRVFFFLSSPIFSLSFFSKTRAVGACVCSPFCSVGASTSVDVVVVVARGRFGRGCFVFSLRLARAENFFVFFFDRLFALTTTATATTTVLLFLHAT